MNNVIILFIKLISVIVVIMIIFSINFLIWIDTLMNGYKIPKGLSSFVFRKKLPLALESKVHNLINIFLCI